MATSIISFDIATGEAFTRYKKDFDDYHAKLKDIAPWQQALEQRDRASKDRA